MTEIAYVAAEHTLLQTSNYTFHFSISIPFVEGTVWNGMLDVFWVCDCLNREIRLHEIHKPNDEMQEPSVRN